MLIELILLTILVSRSEQNVVETAQGKLNGVAQDGYMSYFGIPYGSMSGNATRFKSAALAPSWMGIREVPQPHCTTTSPPDECLRLDVHVPKEGAPWPVLVWVRGGGQYHVGQIVRQGVIVVVVYHRLGPTGFLCLNKKIPGNAGAKDAVLALRWVRDNIVAFRGNPDRIVVGGQGFEAAIVEAMMLSPMAYGLYHGVILQSGTVLSPAAFNYDAKERAAGLANMFDNNDVAQELLDRSTTELVIESEKMEVSYFPFGMCVEKEVNGERFLYDAPINLLNGNKVNSTPMIIGYNSDEAYIFLLNLKDTRVLERMKRGISFLLPEELRFINEGEISQVSREIKRRYFTNNVSMSTVLAYHRDAYFVSHVHRSARFHASSSQHPVYYYQFSHSGQSGISIYPGTKKKGAAHSDELAYLFPENGKHLEGEDGVVQAKLVNMWIDFVKFLNPTPQGSPTWEPMSPHNPRLLDINTETTMREFPHSGATGMWDSIYDKYYYERNHALVL